jgi:hypothetical protein
LVKVRRAQPRPRDRLEGLVGRLAVRVRGCSRASGDPLDSYLHVGTGAPRLKVDEARLKRAASAARTRGQLMKVVEDLSHEIQLGYMDFASVRGGVVLPGASVKGNVRARLELSLAPKDGYVRSCLIRASEEPLEPPPPGRHGWRHFRLWPEALGFAREPACDYTEGEGGVCLLCDLFGTAGLQGLVAFNDFVGERVELRQVDLPTGERLLAAPPGSAFSGAVAFASLRPWELGLLLYGMGLRGSRLGRPVLLGKVKYRRYPNLTFGVVRYEATKLELAPLSQPLEAGGMRVGPGSTAEGESLDRLAQSLVGAARAELGAELLDVDEVGRLEQLKA